MSSVGLKGNAEWEGVDAKGSEITCVTFSEDNNTLLSRSRDGTMKIWDTRLMMQPKKVFDNLPNDFPNTDAIFSPDEQVILTCTSSRQAKSAAERGNLVFVNRVTLEIANQVSVSQGSLTRLLWHPKLNQVIAGSTDNGAYVLYDPQLSKNGALLAIGRKARRKEAADFIDPT